MQKDMEYIIEENRLLKLKLEKIITGKPWRTWMSIVERNPKLILKKAAKQRYNEQMAKISARAYKAFINNSNPVSESGAVSTNLRHNNDSIIGLNNQMSATPHGKEGMWMVKALQVALKSECYDIAEGLSENLLVRLDALDLAAKKEALVLVVSTYISTGKYEAAIALLNLNVDIVLKNHILFTLYSTLNSDEKIENFFYKLPNGKINAFYVFTKRANIKNIDYVAGHIKEFESNPQLNLLISSTLKNDKSAYLAYFNKALHSYKVDQLVDVDLKAKNVFCSLEFKPPVPVLVGPLVSVIMSAYNSIETVGYAIDSVLSQSYMNLELLVCDDCSTDGTFEFISETYKGDPRVKIFRSEHNQGTYNIRNAMINHANGEFITFHDSDDFCLPSRIHLQVAHLLEANGIGCVTRLIRLTEDGIAAFFKDHNAVRLSPVTFMAHARVFKDDGNYLPVKVGGDIEFMERLKEVYGDSAISTIKSPLMLALWSDSSMTRTSGLESLENGYRAPIRRVFSEAIFMRQLYGDSYLNQKEFELLMSEVGNYIPPAKTNKC